jgi:hypothetical protein
MHRYEAALDEMEKRPDGDFILFSDHLDAVAAARKQVLEEVAKTLHERLLTPGGPIAAATNAVLEAGLADDSEQACGIAYQIVGAAVHNAYGVGK